MEDQLITFETAKLAKEHGFKFEMWEALAKSPLGWEREIKENLSYIQPMNRLYPSQTLLREWLRMEHFIHIIIIPYGFKTFSKDFVNPDDTYSYGVYDNTKWISDGVDLKTYEDALEVALREGLRLVTEENHKIINL